MKLRLLNYFRAVILLPLLLTSCVLRHVTPTHNTPHFTGKNQVEFGFNAGATGMNANVAYTPIKYLSVQLNGCSSLSGGSKFNTQAEGGIGAYLPFKNMVMGITGGYGLGATAWTRWWYAKESSGELFFARFNTKKYFLDYYLSYKLKDNSGFMGISIKANFLTDLYSLSYLDEHNFTKTNYTRKNISREIVYFFKRQVGTQAWFTLNAGLSVYPSSNPQEKTFQPILTLGYVFKF